MATDPYAPPDSNVAVPDDRPERPVLGILLAFLFDFFGTFVGVGVLTFVYAIVLGTQGLEATDIEAMIASGDPFTLFGALSSLMGLTFSSLSGYLCIRISRGKTLRYPLILAVITLVVAAVFMFSSGETIHLLVLTVLAFVATLLGAKIALNGNDAANA